MMQPEEATRQKAGEGKNTDGGIRGRACPANNGDTKHHFGCNTPSRHIVRCFARAKRTWSTSEAGKHPGDISVEATHVGDRARTESE